jgi:DNA-directed RNA polymerase specialized sigma24 family protein
MDRLASQARLLQRQIYASLPFSHKVAVFYLRYASDYALFGRVMYAEFIRAGVHGPSFESLPDIEIRQTRTDYRKIPVEVGAKFGKIVYQRLYKLIHADHEVREEAAQEIMTNFMVRVMDPGDTKAKCRPGIEDKQAFAWTHTIMGRNAWLWNRDHGRARGDDAMDMANPIPTRETDHGRQEIEFADPSVMQSLIKDMPRSEWSKLEQELMEVVDKPRERELLMLKLDGWTNAEVAAELGISAPFVGQTLKKYQQDITRTIQRYL